MKARLVILMLAVLAGSAEAGDSEFATASVGFNLQPASNEPLRSVPGPPVYRSIWDNAEPSMPVVQTSFTTTDLAKPAADTVGPDMDSANESAHAEPFIDLLNETPDEPLVSTSTGGTNEMFVRLAVWTVIILCLCILTLLALRRWQRRQGLLPPGAGQSRVLETLSIGPGRAVSLIQLGSVRAVVGTDGSGIKTIVLAPPAFEERLSEFNDDASSISTTGDAA